MSRAERPKTIEEYATLQVALTQGSREEVLATFGIDEDDLGEIDDEFQEALSRAMDEESEGVPALLTVYDSALRKARRDAVEAAPPVEILSLEEFGTLTRAIEGSKDVAHVFSSRGITFEQYLRASEHWTPMLATDADLAQRFSSPRRKLT